MFKITIELEYSENDMQDSVECAKELACILEKLKDNANWITKAVITNDDTQK